MSEEMDVVEKTIDGGFSILGWFCDTVAYHAAKIQVEAEERNKIRRGEKQC